MLLKVYEENPNEREISKIVDVLQNGGVVIYPTDTVYGMGCAFNNKKAIERILRIKGLKEKDAVFSLICSDLSNCTDFAKLSNQSFKIMKKNLPGAFTFVLPASSKVPDKFLSKRKTVGLRIPDNKIVSAIVAQLGIPLLNTSIKNSDDSILEYPTDPELIYEKYENQVDIVIDGGYGDIYPSTIVDCTGNEFEILRQGKGELVL